MSRLALDSKLSKAEMASRDFHISDILRALTEVESADRKKHRITPKVEKPGVLSV